MTLLVELLGIAQGLYVLMGAVILLGGLAIFTVEALRHLSRRNAQMTRPSVSNIFVNHLHIHVPSPTSAEYQPRDRSEERLPLPETTIATAPDPPGREQGGEAS